MSYIGVGEVNLVKVAKLKTKPEFSTNQNQDENIFVA